MISVKNFFKMSLRELETYLYDKFPIRVNIDASMEEYLEIIRDALGINIIFQIEYLEKYIKNRIIKKNEVSIRVGSLGSDYIVLYSDIYKSTIIINGIYSPEPKIQKIEGKNRARLV